MKNRCCLTITVCVILACLINITTQAQFKVNSGLFQFENNIFKGLANFASDPNHIQTSTSFQLSQL